MEYFSLWLWKDEFPLGSANYILENSQVQKGDTNKDETCLFF